MSQEIARIVNNLMTRCGLPLSNTPIDEEFLQLCLENAAARGCPMEAAPGIPAFRPFISIGATMAYTSYGHLESLPATLYIALHATLVTYIEDVYSDQPDLVNAFNHSFVMRLPQQTAVLQKLDDLLAETSKHFDAIQANLILTSTMNFMTSIAIEHGVNKLNLRPEADGFPQFLRGLSGISCAYCMFIFPKDVHIDSYIQAIPSMMDFINHMNDVLSFHKEEVNGDNNNYISIMSKHRGVQKIETLEQLTKLVASSCEAANNILRTSSAAHAAWGRFTQGYVSFHASYARYRLHEVLQVSQDSIL